MAQPDECTGGVGEQIRKSISIRPRVGLKLIARAGCEPFAFGRRAVYV
jgi:hypothetical protein